MPTPRQRVQREILRRRGVVPEQYRGLKPKEIKPDDGTKTLTMRLLEREFGVPIEDLLHVPLYGRLEPIAERLGIDISTVSKWRLKLGLREPRIGTPI